jgi:hypothetical protein
MADDPRFTFGASSFEIQAPYSVSNPVMLNSPRWKLACATGCILCVLSTATILRLRFAIRYFRFDRQQSTASDGNPPADPFFTTWALAIPLVMADASLGHKRPQTYLRSREKRCWHGLTTIAGEPGTGRRRDLASGVEDPQRAAGDSSLRIKGTARHAFADRCQVQKRVVIRRPVPIVPGVAAVDRHD